MNELFVRPILAVIGAAVAGLALLSSGHAVPHAPIYGAICSQAAYRTHTIRLVSEDGGCYEIGW